MANSKSRSESHRSDLRFLLALRGIASIYIVILIAFGLTLLWRSWSIWSSGPVEFLSSATWNPVLNNYGALAFLWGSVVTSVLALVVAAPIGILCALAIQEILPKNLKFGFRLALEWLAIVPSVVWGLWGLFVLVPIIRSKIQPFLQSIAGDWVLFSGPPLGLGMLSSAVLLAIMITPTIIALGIEVFSKVSQTQKEAALALGASRLEMIRLSVLRPSWPALASISILALGRALGETMAVAMVIGNRATLQLSLFSPAATITSTIANEYAEATQTQHVAALVALGLVLLCFSTLTFALSRWGLNQWTRSHR